MSWWHSKANIQRSREALGDLDTEPIIYLTTFTGEELSLSALVARDTDNKPLFPPVDSNGLTLPFFCEGELNRSVGNSNQQYESHRAYADPCSFGLRDILRFVEVPPPQWYRYTDETHDYPECRSCEFAVLADGSTNGAQISCSQRFRPGRIPACSTFCHRQKIRIERGDAALLSNEQQAALAREQKRKEEMLDKNEEAREEKAKPAMKRKKKLPTVVGNIEFVKKSKPPKPIEPLRPPPKPKPANASEQPKPRRMRRRRLKPARSGQ